MLYSNRYLYCESIELAEADIFDVLYAARKYMITELEAKCFNYLSQNMTANNVCMIFNHALFYEETDLEAQCLKFLSNNTRDVIESEEYLNLTKEGMRKVVQLQTMNVPEVEIVKMCLSWAETECGRTTGEDFDPSCVHDYLGDSFYHLRLTNLHQSDLQSLVLGTGLLEQNEEESVVKFLKNSYQRSECQFVTVPRRLRESGQFVCQLASKHCTHQSMDCKKPHVHLFKVSEDISLRGFNIVDSAGIYLNGIHITIAQHNRIVFRTSMRIPAAREETQLGKVVPIHLPKHIPVKAGQFEIHLSFRAIGNRVGSCLPLQEPIDVNGIRFEAVKEDSFHICCLKFSTE